MEIVPYKTEYKNSFIELNLSWINKYFKVEAQDLEMLNGVEKFIAKGAAVYFAADNDKVIATCMVNPLGNNVWEICKLATDDKYQGKGAGYALLKTCINYAKERNAEKLIIVSNSILKAAMHLYEKIGFREVPIDNMEYERVNIQFELKLQ